MARPHKSHNQTQSKPYHKHTNAAACLTHSLTFLIHSQTNFKTVVGALIERLGALGCADAAAPLLVPLGAIVSGAVDAADDADAAAAAAGAATAAAGGAAATAAAAAASAAHSGAAEATLGVAVKCLGPEIVLKVRGRVCGNGWECVCVGWWLLSCAGLVLSLLNTEHTRTLVHTNTHAQTHTPPHPPPHTHVFCKLVYLLPLP